MTEKEKKDAKEILDLVEKLNQEQENQIQNILELTEKFGEKWENVKEKYPEPYNFNLVDELPKVYDQKTTYENTHSEILAKILQYNDKRNFPFVQSFLKAMGILEKVKNPQVFAEKQNIDILILDEKYAVVIENKIHYAHDQKLQLKRYYETAKNMGYEKEHIYVMYLTRAGYKKVSEYSLPKDTRKELGDNFIEINFKIDILQWLEKDVLPDCLQKEKILISGIWQYIYHLKGMFNLRSNQNKIDMELKEFLKKELGLNKDLYALTEEDLQKLYEKTENAEKVAKLLPEIKNEIKNPLRKTFLEKLLEKLNGASGNKWVPSDDNFNVQCFHLTYKVFFNDYEMYFEIQNRQKVLCGIYPVEKHEEMIEKFKSKEITMQRWGGDSGWIHLPYSEYGEYSDLAKDFYRSKFNILFIKKMDILVDHFFERIEKVRKAWDAICEEEKNEK